MGQISIIHTTEGANTAPDIVLGYGDNPEARILCNNGKRMCQGLCENCKNNRNKYKQEWILERAANLFLDFGCKNSQAQANPDGDELKIYINREDALRHAEAEYMLISENILSKKIALYKRYYQEKKNPQVVKNQILHHRSLLWQAISSGANNTL